jgi:uncharacterized membrane protein
MAMRLALRIVATALASAGYVLGCHWLMTRAPASPWNVVGVLAPMLAVIAIGCWRGGQRGLAAIAGLALALLCGHALLGLQIAPQRLYVAQHVGIHLFLAAAFGGTLRAGHTPLITTLARRVHRDFSAAMARYTRHCTIAWTLYFVAMAAVSIALYESAAFGTWALFANLLTPVSLVAMFGGEYLLRYRLHPEFERTSMADAIRAYRLGGAK